MNAHYESDHVARLRVSAARLAAAILAQARSLARFPPKRLDEDMVTYDLLGMIQVAMLLRLTNDRPGDADVLTDQLADDVHLAIERWRMKQDAEEEEASGR